MYKHNMWIGNERKEVLRDLFNLGVVRRYKQINREVASEF